MSEELKSCPMCSGKAKTMRGHETVTDGSIRRFYRVFCTKCRLQQLFYPTKGKAITAWNTRAGEKA